MPARIEEDGMADDRAQGPSGIAPEGPTALDPILVGTVIKAGADAFGG